MKISGIILVFKSSGNCSCHLEMQNKHGLDGQDKEKVPTEYSTFAQTPSMAANFSENISQYYYSGLQGLTPSSLAPPSLIWSHFLLTHIHSLYYTHSENKVMLACYSHHLKSSFPNIYKSYSFTSLLKCLLSQLPCHRVIFSDF